MGNGMDIVLGMREVSSDLDAEEALTKMVLERSLKRYKYYILQYYCLIRPDLAKMFTFNHTAWQ